LSGDLVLSSKMTFPEEYGTYVHIIVTGQTVTFLAVLSQHVLLHCIIEGFDRVSYAGNSERKLFVACEYKCRASTELFIVINDCC
jgi:hypothetical protein